jgi:Rps23 Pro-64 3,4-dihydroxylase Tpa1-like proline 4-hydroxylase
MKYHNLSSNIIACENFLPKHLIENIYVEFLNNRSIFKIPEWTIKDGDFDAKKNSKEFFSEKCGGLDFWMNWDDMKKDSFVESLGNWFFHQGFFQYVNMNNDNQIFSLLKRKVAWDIHVISYNNGGYYNWHMDSSIYNLFTFNLVLNKSNNLKGGEMLFMDDGKIIEVENQNNYMVCFPSFINHAINPLYSKDDKDVSFLDQRFSIQFWVRFL